MVPFYNKHIRGKYLDGIRRKVDAGVSLTGASQNFYLLNVFIKNKTKSNETLIQKQ